MRKEAAVAILLLVAAACTKEKAPDVLDQGSEPAAVGRTVQCTTPNADGVRCDVKTCKADAASDCSQFEDGCVQNNHTYTGDKNSGTCKRGPLIGRSDKRGSALAVHDPARVEHTRT